MSSQTSFSSSYSILVTDFVRLCEYVDPTDQNEETFSHRTFELFLRICTELENVWKQILREKSHSGKEMDWNIYEYRKIESDYGVVLSSQEVTFAKWKPDPSAAYFKPFDNWCSNNPPLNWYSSYNKVKHDREKNFNHASLKNVLHSLGALHITLVKYYGSNIFNHHQHAGAGHKISMYMYSSIGLLSQLFLVK